MAVPAFPTADLAAEDDGFLTSRDDTRPLLQRWTAADPLSGKATTPRWFTESAQAQQAVLARASAFTSPLLVLTGSADRQYR